MQTNSVKVNIFGQTYTIKGEASPDYIRELSIFLNEKMDDVSRNISSANPTQVAILTALNIADEYFQMKKLKSGVEGIIEERAKAIISMLDEGLIGDVMSRVRV